MAEIETGRTLSRGLRLLRALMRPDAGPKRLNALALESDLHRATAHRLLHTLVAEGFVEVVDGAYALGPEARMLGLSALQSMSRGLGASASLGTIAQRTGDVALLSLRVGAFAQIVGREEGDSPILPTYLKPGVRRPLGCGAHALAVLAGLEDDEVADILVQNADDRRHLENFHDDRLLRLVRRTRDKGFAESDGDIVEGMSAVAVAITDLAGRPVASLSCASISSRLGPDRRPWIVEMLREEAARHSQRPHPAGQDVQGPDGGPLIGVGP